MSLVVVFDEGASPQKVLEVHASANTPDWDQRSDVLINPDLAAVNGVPESYWKVVVADVLEYSQAEKDAQDAAEAAAEDLALREGAKGFFNGQIPIGLILRAFADIVKDEFNILRDIHGLAPRTLAQLKAAIQARVDSGDVDE